MVKQKFSEIIFVTSNKGKLDEAKAILSGINVVNNNFNLPELQGEPEEIVKEKLKLAYNHLKNPVIVEDTSLFIDAFSSDLLISSFGSSVNYGLPGPYIKHFISKMGVDKLSKLIILSGETKAIASCIFGYMDKDKIKLFKGEITGRIVAPRGINGFGWDSIFQPDGYNKTFAEMGVKKNQISHRKLALEKMRSFFEKA
jgi:inosine triphosphate pyrophosphatase